MRARPLRRRVYEILLANSVPGLRRLDGLPFAQRQALTKDECWERLVELGILKVSTRGT